MNAFLRNRLIIPILNLLKQGITPDKLALSLGLGLAFGIFPMIGATTLLCATFGFLFRVNQPAIQLINYFTFPLQLLLYIPFFSMGAWLFGAEAIPFSVNDIYAMIAADPLGTIKLLWWANVRAVAAWMLVGPLLAYLVFRILTPVLARVVPQKQTS